MPKGKSKKLSKFDKQKRKVDSRLMEISYRVEKHIFKNKFIEESLAESYLQEMSSYKKTCLRDPRAMQVLEKLTNIMKGIISEARGDFRCDDDNNQTDFLDNIEHENNISSPLYAIPSPVYSLDDEDKYLTQSEIYNIETIDLCSGDVDLSTTGTHYDDTTITLNKALSNIYIHNNDIFPENSQSILTNNALTIDPIKNMTVPKNNKDDNGNANVQKEINSKSHKNAQISNTVTNKKPLENNNTILNEVLAGPQIHVTDEAIDNSRKVRFFISKNIGVSVGISNSASEIQPKNINITNSDILDTNTCNMKNFKIVDSQGTNISKPKINKPRKKTIPKNTKLVDIKIQRNVNNTKNRKASKNKSKKVTDVNYTNLTLVDTVKTSVTTQKSIKVDKRAKTELSQATDELSWLKNIRFVREVEAKEYETGLYDENFWNNLAFPDDLNS